MIQSDMILQSTPAWTSCLFQCTCAKSKSPLFFPEVSHDIVYLVIFLECNGVCILFFCMLVLLWFECCIMFVPLFYATSLSHTICTSFPFIKSPLTCHGPFLHHMLLIVDCLLYGVSWMDVSDLLLLNLWAHSWAVFKWPSSCLLPAAVSLLFAYAILLQPSDLFIFPSWGSVIIRWVVAFFWSYAQFWKANRFVFR